MNGLLFVVFTGALAGILLLIVSRALRKKSLSFARRPSEEYVPVPPAVPSEAREVPADISTIEKKIRLEEERDFIFKLNEKLSFSVDGKTIAKTITEEVANYLNLGVCALFLYDVEAGTLMLEAVSGVPTDSFNPRRIPSGQSITGEVARTRQPLMINDLSSNDFFNSLNTEEYLKNSFVSVPMVFQNELIGVVNAVNKRSGAPFREGDKAFLNNVARVGGIAFKNCRLIAQMQKDYLNTITALALLIDARDSYTKRHSENVTKYAVALAGELRLSAEQVELIRRAGLLHDIGKIGVRDSVLLKPGKLTDEEFEQIKSHAPRGAEIVATLPSMLKISMLVRHHHEKYDGKGYPDGRKGEEIELGARILAVADTFDAMTTDRPYRKALTLEEATAELVRCKGTQFDPALVDCFLSVLERDPGLLNGDQVSSPARPARDIP